jgi:hypothetical protein
MTRRRYWSILAVLAVLCLISLGLAQLDTSDVIIYLPGTFLFICIHMYIHLGMSEMTFTLVSGAYWTARNTTLVAHNIGVDTSQQPFHNNVIPNGFITLITPLLANCSNCSLLHGMVYIFVTRFVHSLVSELWCCVLMYYRSM